MKNNKIQVLLAPSDLHGVGHFRNIWPAQSINKYYSDEFDVEINAMPNFDNIEYFKQFDIIHFHRQLGPHEKTDELFAQLRAAGVVLIMDIDDYWAPPSTHPLYEIVKQEKLTEKIIEIMQKSDYVSTTTNIFADHIRKHNKNVLVLPNALDMKHPMWKSPVKENLTGKCRISWIGGSSHMHDLLHLGRGVRDVYSSKELEDKFQFIMCGFDTRGTITEITPDQQRHTRNIRPEETIWMKFESVFTNKYEGLRKDPEYVTWLKKIKREEYPDMDNKTYIRRWTLPLTKYGEHYDSCDVCLAPLEEDDYTKTDKGQVIKELNLFNEVKSELKIIEAGMKRKVLIAQDCGIYRELLENGKTGILIKNDRKDWYRAMKKVILDKEYRDMLADNLHEYVMAKYELKTVTAHRVKIYKQVIEEMKAKRAMASKTVIPIESKTEEIA